MEKRAWAVVLLGFVLSASLVGAQDKKSPTKKLPPKKTATKKALSNDDADSVAKENFKRPPLDPNRTVRIEYTNLKWNSNSTRSDSATVVLRDAQSGRTVNVQLYETGPDSGQFRGYYNITWGASTEVQPEIYVPTQPLKESEEALPIQQQLKLSKMRRLPFILRKGDKDEQLIEVFNSKQDAIAALESYKSVAEAKQPPKDTIAAKAMLETAELAKLEAQKKQEAEDTAKRESERRKLEDLERQRNEELKRQQEAVSVAERERRKKLAQQHASTAMDMFRSGDFPSAEQNFKKAYELDPENTSFYFGYGVTLYRLDKNNDSIVMLKMAQGGDFNPAERDFFLGLNHLKLKEYPQAVNMFQKAKVSNHPDIAPSAAFYEGVVHFTELRFEPAKVSFQEVLDTSKDPKLDQSAEDYIERIERTLRFIRNKEKQFLITLMMGVQYDSNVLQVNTSDPSTGSATDVADSRTMLGTSFEYRPVYDKETEFSAKVKTDMMFSQKSTNVGADPWVYSLKLPYKHKGMLWGKGFKMEIIPGYEVMKLDTNASGASKSFFAALPEKETYLNSITLDWLNTRVMSDDWFTGYHLKLRSDSVGADAGSGTSGTSDPSAFKVTFVWNNMWFLNKKKTQGYITDLGFTQNSAIGSNLAYSRIDLSGTYMFPWVWETIGVAGLSSYLSQYSQRTPSRQDTNISASFALIKSLNEWLKTTAAFGYSLNESNITSSKYNKFTGALIISGDWSF